jgi:DNA-binding response OmpR family regulator
VPPSAPTVLLVEDDRAMRLLCRVNLELDGYRVLEAPLIPVARELLGTEEIDLVLLDVHVGGEEGWDLLGQIRERDRPVVLMTGSAQVPPEQRLLVDELVAKPFKVDELLVTVARLTREKADR